MPIYEYECENGHRHEVLTASFRDRVPWRLCETCWARAHAVISVTQWQFGEGPKESDVSAAIKRVRRAEAAGKL